MAKNLVHHIGQKRFFDPSSFPDLGFTSVVKLELVSKSVTFGPSDEI